MNIEKYRFERSDLVVATAVNGYLKNLTTEARKETLVRLICQDSLENVINGEKLAILIESAKAAAMTSSEVWENGDDPIFNKTLTFIREVLPGVDGAEYVKAPPEEFLRFIEDWTKE